MGLESSLQSSVLKYLNGLEGCVAENVSGNARQSGRPDVVGCYKGRMFRLELKTPDHKNEPSLKQKLDLRRWLSSGCVCGVVYSLGFIKKVFAIGWDTHQELLIEETERGCKSWVVIPRNKEGSAWQVFLQ